MFSCEISLPKYLSRRFGIKSRFTQIVPVRTCLIASMIASSFSRFEMYPFAPALRASAACVESLWIDIARIGSRVCSSLILRSRSSAIAPGR